MSDFDDNAQEHGARAPSASAGGPDPEYDGNLFAAILNSATAAVFVMDKDGHCVYMNPAAEQLTGFTLAEAQGRPIHDVVHHTRPDGSPYPLEECPIDRALPRNERAQGEEVFVRKDGTFVPVAYMASPMRQGGGITGTIIEVIDITERKRAEAALASVTAESERQRRLYETILSNTPDLVYVFDLDYRFTYVNDALLKTWGRTLEQSVGRTLPEIGYEPWHAEMHKRELDELVAGKTPIRGEVPFEHATLGQRVYDYIFVPVLNAEGAVEAIAGTTRDITEYKQAEAALREAHLLLEAATSAGGVVAWVWDIPQDRMRGNAAFARLFSVDPEGAARGLPLSVFAEAIDEDDRERVLEAVERAIETGEPYGADYRVHAVDESVRWVTVRGRVEYDSDGKPLKFTGVLVDITERKEAEAERERLIEALAKARSDLEHRVEERTAELRALNSELESFNYSVSHDLRTPLRGIDGFSQLLLQDYQDVLDDTARGYLHRIKDAAQRMGHLIDDMLTLSHLSRGAFTRKRLDLSSMAEKVLENLCAAEPRRRVEANIEEGITGDGDEGFLTIVLENLLGNAWKFTCKQDRARIEFGVTRVDGEKIYRVRDNGVGFDMRYADKLFTPFQRLHSPSDFQGTGIGLAIAQRIIQRHGGRIWATAEPGKGASFCFTLPSDDR